MFDPEAPPRTPAIAAALGPVRAALACLGEAKRLLIACSGGADSIAALGLLLLLRRSERLELGVGHVDHGLRPESASEAEAVSRLADTFGLPSFVTRLQLERGPGLPARARQARRVALRSHADQFGASWIVLAHTATDQAETMLMHMTRGAGLDGLAAMPTLDRPWLRPLLELTRDQTRALALALELPFFDDPTNDDETALRVRLRKQVLPLLRDQNPRVEQAMLTLARQAADADRACEAWARNEVEARTRSIPATPPATTKAERPNEWAWDLDGFDRLPRAVRMRALRRMCELACVDLSQLRARIVEAMDAAALEVALARAGGPGTPSPAPRCWDLRPRRRITIDKKGVRAHQTAQ